MGGGLQPPWNKINEKVQENKQNIDRVLQKIPDATTPEERGRALYAAKGKKDNSPPIGNIKAFQEGSCIVIVCDNEADLRRLNNIEERKGVENVGAFNAMATYTFGTKWSDTHTEIPTIVVLDSGEDTAKSRIAHEKNHYYMGLYLRESKPSALINRFFARSEATQAVDSYNSHGMNEDQLLESLRAYSHEMKTAAILESTAQMMASQEMDWRDSYADEYFEDIIPIDPTESAATQYIHQVQKEFQQDYRAVQQKVAQVLGAFVRMEPDPDIVCGTVGMKLLTADSAQIEAVIEEMQIIRKLESREEYYDIRQDLDGLEDDIRYIAGSPDNLAKQVWDRKEDLTKRLVRAANNAKVKSAFGYETARKVEGKDFETAMAEAALARAAYLEEIEDIPIKVADITDTVAKQKDIQKARWAIASQTPTDQEQVPTVIEKESPPQRTTPLRTVMNRLKELIGKR